MMQTILYKMYDDEYKQLLVGLSYIRCQTDRVQLNQTFVNNKGDRNVFVEKVSGILV